MKSVNERQAKALWHLQEHDTLDMSTFRELCPYWSPETLRLDLANLVKGGLLVKKGTKRGTYYVLAAKTGEGNGQASA